MGWDALDVSGSWEDLRSACSFLGMGLSFFWCSCRRGVGRLSVLLGCDFCGGGVRSAFVRTCQSFCLFAGFHKTGSPDTSAYQLTLNAPPVCRVDLRPRLSNYQYDPVLGNQAWYLPRSHATQSSSVFRCQSLSLSHTHLLTLHEGTCTWAVIYSALLSLSILLLTHRSDPSNPLIFSFLGKTWMAFLASID